MEHDDRIRAERERAPASPPTSSRPWSPALLLVVGLVVIFEQPQAGLGLDQRRPRRRLLPVLHRPDPRASPAPGILYQALFGKKRNTEVFVDSEQLRRVLSVLVPAVVYVLAIQFLGIYVASAIYIALFMIVLGKYSPVKSVDRRRSRSACSSSSCSRSGSRCRCSRARSTPCASWATDLGTASSPRTRCAWMNSAPCSTASRHPDADEHRADVRRHHPRRADRRAARPGRRQRRRHPAAAHLHDVADLGDHHAVVHLLGRAVRRRHHLDPVQHPGRAVVGGDHLRRLPDGAAGPGRRGADRRLHLVVHRRLRGGGDDHLPGAAGGEVRAASSARPNSSPSTCSPSAASSAWARARRSRSWRRWRSASRWPPSAWTPSPASCA